MHMQIQTPIECEAAASDLVLQAARAALPPDAGSYGVGERNKPLMPLLVALLDAADAVASAVADNCRDTSDPLPADLADQLGKQARGIASELANASPSDCPDASRWAPSMTGKELV